MDTAIDAKAMPHDAQAELAVLSSMLFDNEALVVGCEALVAQDFYRKDYRLVFQSLMDLYSAGKPADLVTLSDNLKLRGNFEAIGGIETLGAIVGDVATAAHIKQYAKIVQEKSVLRQLIRVAGTISQDSLAGLKPAEVVVEAAEAAIFAIGQKRGSQDFVHVQEAINTAIDVMQLASERGEPVTGLASGFTDLDALTAGFHPADLVLIAARPSMGKTALVLNIAANAAIRQKASVAIFSLEMSKESLATRLLSSEGRVDASKMRTGQLGQPEWDDIAIAVNGLSAASIYIDDMPGITVAQMRSKCRKFKSEKGLDLVIVDYIQLMSGSDHAARQNRQQEISEISRGLKALAREMNCPVIALSQLSRAPETRGDRRPVLSDLRESGAIEQDADLVCFIYRDEYYNRESEKAGIAELIVAKQRNGATGVVELLYRSENVRFDNYTHKSPF